LAGFSLDGHGKGNCEKLLTKFALKDVFDLTVADIVTIDGFAEKSAKALVNSLKAIKPEFDALMELGFTLVETIRGGVARDINDKIADKLFVITGTLVSSKREDMYTQIKSKGGLIGTKVTSKTDYLVIGLNVGAGKTGDAKKNGTTVITEAEFLEMIT
jgi:DNA ligase (NAD+)